MEVIVQDLKMPQNVVCRLRDFIDIAKQIYGEGLNSITLYGSAASGEFSTIHSNINLVVVLNNTSLSNLSKIATALNENKFRLLNVLFFTESYIKNSADLFPVEFLDIKENHKTVYGKDIFANLPINIRNLRFQCEQELRSKIVNIKKVYLANINNPDLDKLLIKFFISSLHILRNILRLKNKQAVYQKEYILRDLAAEFHIDISDMSKILEFKKANRRFSKKAAAELFNSFVNDLEKIAGC